MRDPAEKYLKKKFTGGRGAFARAVDYAALRLVLLIAAYLLLRSKALLPAYALSLSLVALAAIAVLLRIIRQSRYDAFVRAETERLQKKLFLEGLSVTPEPALRRMAKGLAEGRPLIILRRAEKADADAVLSAGNRSGSAGLLCTGGYTPSARAFAARPEIAITLIEPEALIAHAKEGGLLPSGEDAFSEMRRLYEADCDAKKHRRSLAFSGAFPVKYFLSAALLTALSFFTRYAVYYRLLAILCMGAAAVGALLSKAAPRTIETDCE